MLNLVALVKMNLFDNFTRSTTAATKYGFRQKSLSRVRFSFLLNKPVKVLCT